MLVQNASETSTDLLATSSIELGALRQITNHEFVWFHDPDGSRFELSGHAETLSCEVKELPGTTCWHCSQCQHQSVADTLASTSWRSMRLARSVLVQAEYECSKRVGAPFGLCPRFADCRRQQSGIIK